MLLWKFTFASVMTIVFQVEIPVTSLYYEQELAKLARMIDMTISRRNNFRGENAPSQPLLVHEQVSEADVYYAHLHSHELLFSTLNKSFFI